MSNVLDQYDFLASLPGTFEEQQKWILENGGNEIDLQDLCFSHIWQACGCPRFVLSDSMAALLSATRAPALERLPFDAIVIEVPRRFAIAPGDSSAVWISAGLPAGSDILRVSAWGNDRTGLQASFRMVDGQPIEEDHVTRRKGDDTGEQQRGIRLAVRLLANTVAYVSQHRECVIERRRPRSSDIRTFVADVIPPSNVQVSREFRARAAELILSRSFGAARQALAHMVRGHWRNQHVGEKRSERRLTWVRPHLRGNELLGRVMSRIERITKVEP